MTNLKSAFAVLALGAALGASLVPAFADEGGSNAPTTVAPVIVGRQAAPVAAPLLTDADRAIIDRNSNAN